VFRLNVAVKSIAAIAEPLVRNAELVQQSLYILVTNDGSLFSCDNRPSLQIGVCWIVILAAKAGIVSGLSAVDQLRTMIMHDLEKCRESYIGNFI